MLPLPRGIAIFTAETKEFATFFDALLSGDVVPEKGVLVRYQPWSLFTKIGISALLLFFAACSFYSPDFSFPLPIVIACCVFLALWCLFNSRFEEVWFFVDAEQLTIKRRKSLFPGRKIIRLHLMDIRSVGYSKSPGLQRSTATHDLQVKLKDSRTLTIASGMNSSCIIWLADMLSSWRNSGGGWRQFARKRKVK